MKELGEYLKEQRVSNGVGVDEAAVDLSLTSDDIENIESVEVLESVGDINYLATKFANIDMVQGINDVNLLSHKVFGDVNLKIEKLKNKVAEYFSNNNKEEE